TPPVIHCVHTASSGVEGIPAAIENTANQLDIEGSPIPIRRGQQLGAAVWEDVESAVISSAPAWGRNIQRGNRIDSPGQKLLEGISGGAGRSQTDTGIGIGELCAQVKGVDTGRYAEDGIAGNIADFITAADGAGNGSGN